MPAPEDMLKKAKEMLPRAYAPYSSFHVAACVRTDDGQLFTACNVENSSYPLSSCAEKNAIIQAVCAGQRHITEGLVLVDSPDICSPCGMCRQCFYEFANASTLIHLCTVNGKYQCTQLKDLLPLTFRLSTKE